MHFLFGIHVILESWIQLNSIELNWRLQLSTFNFQLSTCNFHSIKFQVSRFHILQVCEYKFCRLKIEHCVRVPRDLDQRPQHCVTLKVDFPWNSGNLKVSVYQFKSYWIHYRNDRLNWIKTRNLNILKALQLQFNWIQFNWRCLNGQMWN